MNIRSTLVGIATLLSLTAPIAASASGPSARFMESAALHSSPVLTMRGQFIIVQRISRRLLRQAVAQQRQPIRLSAPLAREIL